METLINRLEQTRRLDERGLRALLTTDDALAVDYLHARARAVAQAHYGTGIYVRGLIELTNVCRNDCLYCGIRRSNRHVERYTLTREQVLACCEQGYRLGFRTLVLQGGEWGDDRAGWIADLVREMRRRWPECAITLSLGEHSREVYALWRDSGADRYLLRHETASPEHYAQLHPSEMSWQNRIDCLYALKEIGYQVGCGFMVGSPFQTLDTLYADLQFIRTFQPQMVGIGPFISASGTPFEGQPNGKVSTTLRLLAIIRLLHPPVLLPATTALGTLHPQGRELGIQFGANVVMPNLSPRDHRKDYSIYDNKICTGEEAAECRACTEQRIRKIGYETVVDRGDFNPNTEY